MKRIEVVQGCSKYLKRNAAKFRVLVDFIQEGVDFSTPNLANQFATKLKEVRYTSYELCTFKTV